MPTTYKKRPHRKVKSGCSTCKRRKIKCDELRPTCSNCIRYSSDCIYPSEHSQSPQPSLLQASLTPPDSTRNLSPDILPTDVPLFPQHLSNELPITDLSLLHQWTISTAFSFGDGFPGDEIPWQVDLPILAHRYPFLMRGMLAVAALHLHKITRDPGVRHQYGRLALHHQAVALPDFRVGMSNVNEENIHALMAYGALTTVFALSMTKAGNMFPEKQPPEFVALQRGVGELPGQWKGWMKEGPLKGQLHRGGLGVVDDPGVLNPGDGELKALRKLVGEELPEEEEDVRGFYENAVYWLRQVFALTYDPEARLRSKYAAMLWIERVDQEFLDLMAERRPRALVVLAYVAVLIKRAEHWWFLDGFAEQILWEMQPLLPEEYLDWIRWPMEQCGFVREGCRYTPGPEFNFSCLSRDEIGEVVVDGVVQG